MLLLSKDDLAKLTYKGLTKAKKDLGIAYLGNVAHSSKFMHSYEHGVATYSIYLASSNLSGFKVCPNDKHCKEHCLNGSGRAMMELLKGGNKIMNSRVKKTQLFFVNRDYFMQMMIAEIKMHRLQSELDGLEFSVRINATSDINIEDFVYDGKNILEMFPDVQFYDYTKVFTRLELSKKYDNYDLTYSYNGYNWMLCQQAFRNGFRVAAVFEKELPKSFHGYEVVNGDLYDARYLDNKNVIVGLKYKMPASSVKNNKFTIPETPFVIKHNNMHNVF
jgi:hypothetical protein